MKYIKFVIIFAILNYLFFWVCRWLLELEFVMKPYTPTGKTVFTYVQHTVFASLALVFTIYLTVALEKKVTK